MPCYSRTHTASISGVHDLTGRANREAFLEFYPEEAVKDLEPASFFAKYKTNRISLQQAKDYEEVLVKR